MAAKANEVRMAVGYIMMGTTKIAGCTGVRIRVDGGINEVHADGRYDPIEVLLGNRSTTITVDTVKWFNQNIDIEAALSDNYVDIECYPSEEDEKRGLPPITLKRCKLASIDIASTQDGNVTYSLEFRKAYSS